MLVLILSHLVGVGVVGADTMADAKALEAARNFLQAAQLYLQVAAEPGPDRAEALARAGQCYEELTEPSQALSCYDRLLGFDERSYWAEVAFARKADLSFRKEDREAARRCIARLEEMFPDSPWTVCARVTAARLAGGDVPRAEAAYARELQAFDAYREALRRSQTDDQLQGMEQVIARHPDSATATRAYESKAHLLWKKGLKAEAITPWLAVLERTARSAPKSYIVSGAKLKLGALYRKVGRYQEAATIYESLVSDQAGPELAGKAAYCRIAIDFGRMRDDCRAARPVGQQVDALVNRCRALAADETAGKLERARAAMLPFEILSWGGQSQECVRAAEEFIRAYAGTPYKEEVAMAHFYAGWELTRLHRDPEALPHFQEVIRLTPGQKSLLRTDSIQRSHYHVWRILRATGAPRESIDSAAQALFSAFPDSGYAQAVRTAQRREEAQQ